MKWGVRLHALQEMFALVNIVMDIKHICRLRYEIIFTGII